MTVPVTINFRFTKNAQTGKSVKQKADDLAAATSQFLVQDVVFAAAEYRFREMKTTFSAILKKELQAEMDHMVTMISTMMNPPDGATAPLGSISPASGTPAYPGSITADKAGVHWSQRSYEYMIQKHRKNKPSDWWVYSGKLHSQLSSADFYTNNFGPITVTVSRKAGEQQRDKRGRFLSRRSLPTSTGRVENIQSLGLRGRPSVYYTVATVTVEVFGRITADMLPSLASDNPLDIAPGNRSGRRIIDLIRDRSARQKLGSAKRGEYRQLLDPFLSYYLTRAVPGRVNKVLERQIQRTASSSSTASVLSRV